MEKKRRGRLRTNDPEGMRGRILDAAAESFQSRGYHDTSIQDVKRQAQVTSGAFHHHFPSKKDLGLAVIEERVAQSLRDVWLQPLLSASTVADGVSRIIGATSEELRDQGFVRGCPVNNLAVELAFSEEAFRDALQAIFADWQRTIATRLAEESSLPALDGFSHEDIAAFIIAAYSGAMTLSKAAQTPDRLDTTVAILMRLLQPALQAKRPAPA